MRPDPLAAAAARRHQLTRAKAIQALRELDRAGTVITFTAVATAAGISRSWLYTQPDIRSQIQQLRSPATHRPAAATPAAQRATDASLRTGSPPHSNATACWPRKTPGSAASSPTRSAASDHPGPDPVTIQPPETTPITPPPSRQRHRPRRDGAGHSPG
jgi:hypothetical protein